MDFRFLGLRQRNLSPLSLFGTRYYHVLVRETLRETLVSYSNNFLTKLSAVCSCMTPKNVLKTVYFHEF